MTQEDASHSVPYCGNTRLGALADPVNRLVYDVHQYFDHSLSGENYGCDGFEQAYGGLREAPHDEVPNVLIVILMVIGYIRSVSVFLWVDHGQDLHFILPLWGFGAVMLGMFSPFARVSLQEFLGWGYETLNFSLVLFCVGPPLVIIFVVVLKQAELGGHDAY